MIRLGRNGYKWQPPHGLFGLGATSGVSLYRAIGGGLQYSFDGSSDDELSMNVILKNNGIDYDGSELKLTLYYQLSVDAQPTDNAKLNFDAQFVGIGDDTDQAPSTVTETITLDGKTAAAGIYKHEFVNTFTGAALKEFLMFSSEINAAGAGQGSYTGSLWQIGILIEKV